VSYRVKRTARGSGFHIAVALNGDADTDIATAATPLEAAELFHRYAAQRFEGADADTDYWRAAQSWAETAVYRLRRPDRYPNGLED
jgi:hypothetical protein